MSTLLLTHARLLDPEGPTLSGPDGWLLCRDGGIVDRGEGTPPVAAGAQVLDVGGSVVMPGLIDVHVHLAVTSLKMLDIAGWTEGYAAIRSGGAAERMLRRGFTSVRDVGGVDRGLVRALDEGLVLGPRVQYAGRMISQTGGHGDTRGLKEQHLGCHCEEAGIAVIADGVDRVRWAAREQLRRGASFLKLTASGGVASPHDDISSVQYTEEEIRAAVVEAANANTYVTVHAYHPRAIQQALRAGVGCVEHGNLLDEETAALMKASDAWLVPTLVTYELLAQQGAAAGLGEASLAKIAEVRDGGLAAYALAARSGIPMALGTDLLAEMEVAQSQEFLLRAQVAPSARVVQEATCHGARLMGWEGKAGTLQIGAWADVLVVDANPLEDVRILADPQTHLRAIIKGGQVVPPVAPSEEG